MPNPAPLGSHASGSKTSAVANCVLVPLFKVRVLVGGFGRGTGFFGMANTRDTARRHGGVAISPMIGEKPHPRGKRCQNCFSTRKLRLLLKNSSDTFFTPVTFCNPSTGQPLSPQPSGSPLGNGYLYTGRRLCSETGLYYYRTRYYDANQGRFIGRDPIGYGGGMNLYRYVANKPVTRSDPSGLRGISYSEMNMLLEQFDSKHASYLYYSHSGMRTFIVGVDLGAYHAYTYGAINDDAGGVDQYSPVLNTLSYSRPIESTPEEIIIHELVHARDDYSDWYLGWIPNYSAAEELAWSASHLISSVGLLEAFERSVQGYEKIDKDSCRTIQSRWNGVWTGFAGFPQYVTDAGLLDVRAKLGLHFSCSGLLPVYQGIIDGIAGKGCCILSCPDNLPSSLE